MQGYYSRKTKNGDFCGYLAKLMFYV